MRLSTYQTNVYSILKVITAPCTYPMAIAEISPKSINILNIFD